MSDELETAFRCPCCNRRADSQIVGMCTSCEMGCANMLMEIVGLQATASDMIEPGRTGSGRTSTEQSIGVNVTALAYAANLGYSTRGESEHLDRDGLGMLHEWERLIREERDLVPVALVPYAGSPLAETKAVCRFLLAHLAWASAQAWAVEMVAEVSEVHRAGQIACRAVPPRRKYLTCPGDLAEGGLCANRIPLPEDFSDYVRQPGEHAPRKTIYCPTCQTTWTLERFVRVAIALYGIARISDAFGRDLVAEHLGVSRRHINRLIADNQRGTA